MKKKGKEPNKETRPKVGNASAARLRFVDEYMIDRNATQAAIRAGYSSKTAGTIGGRLLKRVDIADEIARRTDECAKNSGVTVEKIMREYARLAFLDPINLFNDDGTLKAISEIPEDTRRAISGIDVSKLKSVSGDDVLIEESIRKIKLADKKGTLDSLAKIMGLMKDQVEVTMPDLVSALDKARRRIHGK